jgi:hypothetical protein
MNEPLVVQRFTLATGTVGWLLYRSGHLHAPLAALTDSEMTQLLRDVEWQLTQKTNGGAR